MSVLVVASWFIALIIAGRSLSLPVECARLVHAGQLLDEAVHAVSTNYVVEIRRETCVTRPGV